MDTEAGERCADLSYLGADPRGGIAERQDGHVLGPVQPVHCHLGAGGPFHHGDVVVPASTDTHKPGHFLMNYHVAGQPGAAAGKQSRRELWF